LHPDLATGWYNLALAHLALFTAGATDKTNMDHAVQAVDDLNSYLKLEPQDNSNCSQPPCARNLILSTLIDSGQYLKAIEIFQSESALNNKNLIAAANIAKTYADAGVFEEAIKWYQKLADLEESTDGKGAAYLKMGVLDWRRLYHHPEVVGADRAKLADTGLA